MKLPVRIPGRNNIPGRHCPNTDSLWNPDECDYRNRTEEQSRHVVARNMENPRKREKVDSNDNENQQGMSSNCLAAAATILIAAKAANSAPTSKQTGGEAIFSDFCR